MIASSWSVGVAVYYIMPWVGGSTLLSLDGAPAEFVNLTNPNGLNATNVYDIHWRATGLSNGTHTVVSSLQSDGQVARFGEVDGFM